MVMSTLSKDKNEMRLDVDVASRAVGVDGSDQFEPSDFVQVFLTAVEILSCDAKGSHTS